MRNHITVNGAFGRTYPTLKAAKQDWEDGKDFRSDVGPYVNKADAERMDLGVTVRYGRTTQRIGTLR